MQRSIERLSTGKKINRAADDAAGLSISNKLEAEIRGNRMAQRNIMDGISYIQTLDGRLELITDQMQRIRELWVQGLNGSNSSDEIDAIQREINSRIGVIDSISRIPDNRGDLLAKGLRNLNIQSGADSSQTTTLILQTKESGGFIAPDTGICVGVNDRASWWQPDEYGTLLEHTVSFPGNVFALSYLEISGNTVGSYYDNPELPLIGGARGPTYQTGNLNQIDIMIGNLNRMRSYLGAFENALNSQYENLSISIENSSSSNSRILDADIGKEASTLIRNQILQQSASTILAQANSSPQIALNLLP